MKAILLIMSVLTFSLTAQSEVLYYKGTSLTKNAGECLVTLKKEQNNFVGFAVEGEGEVWEILKDNGSTYGPGKEVRHVEVHSLEPRAQVKQSHPLFSRDIVLETSFKLPDTSIRTSVKVRLYIGNNEFLKVEAEQAFRASYVIPIAKAKVTCVDLKQVSSM